MADLSATIQSRGIANPAKPPLIDEVMYHAMYEASIRDPETFWGEHGTRIDWIKPYSRVKNAPSPIPMSRSNGSRTARSTSRPTASTGI